MTADGHHGYLNLQVIAVSGGKAAVADYSVMPAGAAWRAAGGSGAAPSLSFDFATRVATPPTVATVAGAAPVAASRIPIIPTAVSAALQRLRKATDFASAPMPATANPHVTPNYYCAVVAQGIDRDKREHFMTTATESTKGAIPETIIEGTNDSSTHTLGVEYTYAGKGGWGADGTGSITDSSTNMVSETFSHPETIYNRVNYRQYFYECPLTTERRPYSFYDLLTDDGAPAPMTWLSNCTPHRAGTEWTTGSATSATVSGGVTLGPLNVSAQAGFGTSVELAFHFNRAGEICGNNSQGPAHSSLVEADGA